MRNCKIISTYFGPRRSVLMHKDSESKLDNNISDEKKIFLKSIAYTIKSGMKILNVETPNKM